MRSNCAVYVDAGYLLASAATRVTGTSLRNGIHVEYGRLVRAIVEQVEQACGLPVLRVHWYDSARDGVPDHQQERIGELPRVKLRLGRFGVDGQQKGVDLRMGLDLVMHARNRVADIFFLVSGDDDLTEAVEEAQVHGVQVVLLAVPSAQGKPHGISRHLVRAADELRIIAPEAVDAAVVKVEIPQPAVTPQTHVLAPNPEPSPADADRSAPEGASAIEGTPVAAEPSPTLASAGPTIPTPKDLAVRQPPARQPVPSAPPASVLAYSVGTGVGVRHLGEPTDDQEDAITAVVSNVLTSFLSSASAADVVAIAGGRPTIPREIDSALLRDLSDLLDVYDLSDPIRYRLRGRFWEMFEARAD